MFSAIQRTLRLRSVRARLTFWYLVTLGVSLAGFAIFVYLVRAGTLYRELDADAQARAHQFVDEFRQALLTLDIREALAADPSVRDTPVVVRAWPDEVIFRSPASPMLTWASERDLSLAARGGGSAPTEVRDRRGTRFRVAMAQVTRPGAEPLLVQIAVTTEPVQHILRQLAITMALCIAVVLIVASYGSGFTARQALAPVDEIVKRVRAIQAGALGERLDVRAGSDEIDRLVTTLNAMLDRLDGSVQSARRFAADASHELQTPIAVLRAGLEALVLSDDSPAEREAATAELLLEVGRLSTLIRDLRLLALAEAGHLLSNPERFDLSALTSDCSEIARAMAEPRQIQVVSHVATDVAISGSPLHLRRVFLNLASNAVQYSPEGGTIRIALDLAGDRAALSVEDAGCGIGEADLPHIFEPFYRADSARARETGGTGLGLAIVDQIVRLHGGSIDVRSTLGGGSRFTVYLPLAA
jgi:signal transduction histidine kinase